MDIDDDDWRDNLSEPGTWRRIARIVVAAIAWWAVNTVAWALAVIQILWALFAGTPNARLAGAGAALADYLRDLVRFLTWASDEAPFPFDEWRYAVTRPLAPPPPAGDDAGSAQGPEERP